MIPFTTLRVFNRPELRSLANCRGRIDHRALAYFPSTALVDRLVRALADQRAITIKELVESFEFFGRVRRRMRAHQMVDLAAGHGLVGILFAVFEPTVERVRLIDRCRPPNHAVTLAAVATVAPWITAKVEYVETTLAAATSLVPPASSIIAVHGCGKRSDRAIALAVDRGCDLALMPCCYARTSPSGLEAIAEALGSALASDIDRTYRLRAAGYRVDWSSIPEAVTPMNRIIIAQRAGAAG